MNKAVKKIRVCGKCGKEVTRRWKTYFIPQTCPFCKGTIKTKYVMEVK